MRIRQAQYDKRAIAGNIAEGVRTIRPGGRVKFDNFWHSAPELETLVGETVRVCATHPVKNDEVIIYSSDNRLICYAENEYTRPCQHEYEWVGGGGDPAAPSEAELVCKQCGKVADE